MASVTGERGCSFRPSRGAFSTCHHASVRGEETGSGVPRLASSLATSVGRLWRFSAASTFAVAGESGELGFHIIDEVFHY